MQLVRVTCHVTSLMHSIVHLYAKLAKMVLRGPRSQDLSRYDLKVGIASKIASVSQKNEVHEFWVAKFGRRQPIRFSSRFSLIHYLHFGEEAFVQLSYRLRCATAVNAKIQLRGLG